MTMQSFPLTFGLNFGCNSGFQFLPVDLLEDIPFGPDKELALF